MKCSGGCGKEVGDDHPLAVVTCIDCAMDAASEVREFVRDYMKKAERLDDEDHSSCDGLNIQ